jgi:hypothetical protein
MMERTIDAVLAWLKSARVMSGTFNANDISLGLGLSMKRVTAALSSLEAAGCVGRRMAQGANRSQFHYWYLKELPPRGAVARVIRTREEVGKEFAEAQGSSPLAEVAAVVALAPMAEQTALQFEPPPPHVTFEVDGRKFDYPVSMARAIYRQLQATFER